MYIIYIDGWMWGWAWNNCGVKKLLKYFYYIWVNIQLLCCALLSRAVLSCATICYAVPCFDVMKGGQ